MTQYTAISDAETASGQPIKQSLMRKLRDNFLAIIEGDVSAPKMSNLALSTIPGQNYYIKDSAGSDTLQIPAGITSIYAEVCGAGGGAWWDGLIDENIGGGGGEKRCAKISVTPFEMLSIIVGAGGIGAQYTGSPFVGGSSSISRGGSVLLSGIGGGVNTVEFNGIGGIGGTGGVGGTGSSGSYGKQKTHYMQESAASGHCPGGRKPSVAGNHAPGCGGPRKQFQALLSDLTGFDGIVIIRY